MIISLVLSFFLLVFLWFFLNRIGVLVVCDQEELEVFLRLWIISIPIYPKRKKESKKKRKEKEKKRKVREKKKKRTLWEKLQPRIHLRMNYRFIWEGIKSVLPVLLGRLCKLRGKIRVDELEVSLVWAEQDPAAAAIHYGNLCALAGNFLPLLSSLVIIRCRRIDLSVDFQSEIPLWYVRVSVSITLARFLYICLYTAVKALMEVLRVQKNGKENNNGKETSGE